MKALITSRSFGRFCPDAIRLLEDSGIELDFFQDGPGTPESIAARVGDANILIVGNDPITEEVIKAGASLELIHMHGTGLDGIDVDCAASRDIRVSNVNGVNKNSVAELTVALMLMAGRGIGPHMSSLKRGEWKRQAGHELSGSCVGIIGLGNIGRRVVELLEGFSVNVIAFDVNPDWLWLEGRPIEMADAVEDVFRKADFLVLTAPLTETTRNLVNKRTLSLMKRRAVLVNTSRGGLVDDEALVEAISNGRLCSAALDAFREEPLPGDSVLRTLEDIVLTPHMAATSVETSSRVSMKVAENIIEIMSS